MSNLIRSVEEIHVITPEVVIKSKMDKGRTYIFE